MSSFEFSPFLHRPSMKKSVQREDCEAIKEGSRTGQDIMGSIGLVQFLNPVLFIFWQGCSPQDLPLKRKTPDSGLSSSNRLQEELQQNNFSLEMNGCHWQRDTTCNPGRFVVILETVLGGDVPQVDEPWIRTRPISEVRSAMRLQGRGGTIQYLLADEDDEEDEMHLYIDNMSYEELLAIGEVIGNVSRVLRIDAEASCICQEYAEDEVVGKLECEHEYHVGCIKEWLAQKNWCPICKNTALAT